MAAAKPTEREPTRHGFCTVHRIGYDRELDAVCPQCSLAHMAPAEQLDFDSAKQKPLDASGALLNPRTLRPE